METEKTSETPEKKWKVVIADGTPEGKDYDEFMKEMEIEDSRKNFRNWLNNKFPKGYGGYNPYYILTHPWEILREWKRQTRWAYQRVFRGWDDRAVWSMDYHLSKVIGEMVRELQDIKCGVPMGMFEGLPYENENNYSYSDESVKIAEERWDKILNDIAEGFEGYVKIDDLETYEEMERAYGKFFDETFELFKKHYRNLWW